MCPSNAPLPSGILELIEREDDRLGRARETDAPGAHEERRADRLRALPLRVRRQQHVALLGRPIGELCHERRDGAQERSAAIADVQAQIERDLVVARSRRVQPLRHGADALSELGLDGHVHVFFIVRELEDPGRRLVVERAQPVAQRARVAERHDGGAREHRDMRGAPHEVLADERAVVGQRGRPGEQLVQKTLRPGRGRSGDARHGWRLV